MNEHDLVFLKRDVGSIPKGSLGTIVFLHTTKPYYEVEFFVEAKFHVATIYCFDLEPAKSAPLSRWERIKYFFKKLMKGKE